MGSRHRDAFEGTYILRACDHTQGGSSYRYHRDIKGFAMKKGVIRAPVREPLIVIREGTPILRYVGASTGGHILGTREAEPSPRIRESKRFLRTRNTVEALEGRGVLRGKNGHLLRFEH
jgi:hypothetical protein